MHTSFTDWDSELAHYGIPGMKWGVRRYQNSDGTLTEEGKRRYSGEVMFVSGSSKTQDKQSAYYRRKLPKFARQILKSCIKKGDTDENGQHDTVYQGMKYARKQAGKL